MQAIESHRGCLDLSLDHYVSKSLDYLLLIVEYLSALVFILSFQHHRHQHLGVVGLSTTEDYFIKFLEGASGKNASSVYSVYRYYSVGMSEDSIVWGVTFVHRMFEGFSLLVEDLSTSSHHRFCNICDFPEVIESANIRAAPSSVCSMSILSISVFFWGIYLCLLGKRLSSSTQVLGRLDRFRNVLLSLFVVVTIFGVYAFKNAKMSIDSLLVCAWEVMKITLLCLLGCYIDS